MTMHVIAQVHVIWSENFSHGRSTVFHINVHTKLWWRDVSHSDFLSESDSPTLALTLGYRPIGLIQMTVDTDEVLSFVLD